MTRTTSVITTTKALLLIGAIAVTGFVNIPYVEGLFTLQTEQAEIENKTKRINMILITSEKDTAGGDCNSIGKWNSHLHTCTINKNTIVGIYDTIIIREDAILEIPNSAEIVNHGTIKNKGTINIHGHIFNLGTVYNDKIINNDGHIKNDWGMINNNEGAKINNGMFISKEGKIGLQFIGEINNKFGTIHNSGIIANYNIVNNYWGLILNNCTGNIVGSGYLIGTDIRQAECKAVENMDRLQH